MPEKRGPVPIAITGILVLLLILVLAMFFVALNLLVDVMQTALDPRIERA